MRVERVVIAGAGLAGLRTAEELRAKGYTGAITMIGAEHRPPYDRPPLTKKFMTGEIDDTTLRPEVAALGAQRVHPGRQTLTITGDSEAAKMMTRQYRNGFEVPSKV